MAPLLLLPAPLLLLLLLLLLPLAPARAGPAPAARELSSCSDFTTLAPGTLRFGSSTRVQTCSNKQSSTFSARVLNPNNHDIAVYLGVGFRQCGTSFDPRDSAPWKSHINYDRGSTELWAVNNACSDPSDCCVQLYCYDGGDCKGATVSIAFVEPSSTGCGRSYGNVKALAPQEFETVQSCRELRKGSTQSFALYNPSGQRVSLLLTDGAGSQNCGFTWGSGSTFNSYKSVQLSTATSFTFTGVPCETTPCCASVSCQSSGGPCIGLNFVQIFSDPPPLQPNSPPALLPGEIAALLISVLAVAVGVAFFFWHQGRKDQQQAAQAGAGADAPQAQANPLQPFGSAPPTAPLPAPAAKAARAALSAIGGAVWDSM